uniref:myosin-binding protein C, cardiac-type-like isoform X2 n=1 Tax=Ciona intestinalis TaxID=7719 RepID=UPI000180C0B9|nr:myosin-binding protein C, cardiac-type-like isoform X2 [Ciona intestinalis]|eukprot:XP_002130191.1 myosin-binding protein C, cardiac-type-like isoform X2 [Ciona intestinalis]
MPVPGADPAKKILKKKVVKKVVKKRKESVAEKAPAKDVAPKAEEKPVPAPEPVKVDKPKEAPVVVETSEVKTPEKPTEETPVTNGIVEAPENATTTEGVEVTVRVKVMHIDVLHAMKVIWIKGKWKELTKGDRYDMWCNERTGEHFLKFRQPKVSDGGSYKVKAVSPIGENEASFNVAVGPPVVEEHKIEIKKGYVPDEKDVLKDVDFRNRLKKVERLRKEESSGKFDIWSLLKTASTRDYESIAFKFGIPDMRIMLRRLSQMSKLANKKCPSFTKKLPESHSLNLGEKLVLEAEVANEQMTVKWLKNGNEITPGKGYQIVTKANKRYLMIDQTSKDDDATYTCVVGKDVTACEVFVQEPPVTIVKGLEDAQIACGETTEFCCEISNENGKFRFLKDGVDIPSNDRFKVKKEGVKVTLTITEAVIEDEGFYQFMTNGSSSCSELLVQEPAAVFTRAFSDLKVNFKETAEFFCEVSNETTKGNWLKDGKPMKADDRVKITETGKARKLVISGVKDSDQGEYTFAAEDNPTCSITAALEMTGGHITVERKKAPPKIFLDHSLKDRSIQVRAGNKIKLDIPISGEPAPVPEWKKGPKDGKQIQLVQTGKRVWTNTSTEHGITSLVIVDSHLEDSDEYYCDLVWDKEKLEGGDSEYIKRQEIQFKLQFVDVPSAPTVPKVSNVTAETCYAVWTGPSCNGGCEIKGYVMERKKTKSERWIRLNFDPLQGVEYEARRMIEGTEYQLRVRAVNEVGVGEPSPASIPFTPLAPCSEPSGFKVSAATDDSLELSWLPPADIGAAGLDGYLLEQQLVGEEDEKWTTVQSNGGLLPNNTSKILMDKLVTGKKYRFRLAAINKAGSSGFTEIGPVVCAAVVEEAKIVLPRHLLKPVKVKVGGKLHVNVPYQGRPKPQLTWSKEGKALEDHVAVRNSLDSSVLFIRTAERWDSGKYDLQLKVGDDVVGAKVEVAVIDIPSKPRQVKLVEVVGNSASLKWEEPNDSGNTEILGYIVEKRDARSDDWYVVYDKLRHKQCQVSDLVLGNNYFFRVRAFNEVGTGESNGTKDSANIPKEKTVYKKPDYAPMDFRMKPEFTQLLNGRRIVENYNGTLSCALKCNPRPKIKWFKNKIEIIDNPKYKMTQSMGIVQLEIRRARAGDAGNYTVTAINELGEASCSAEVTVKELKSQG